MPLLPRRRTRASALPASAPAGLPTPRAAVWWILLAVALVGAAVAGTLWWLLADLATTLPVSPGSPAIPVPSGSSAPPSAASGGSSIARGEVLRTALAAGAGVGAAITLALAFRRQHHQELTALVTAHDATERRVTELYVKAAEQLGHGQAAVRLAGMYAMERLAQDNPGHRQTIVNVICAYLRMPFTPPQVEDPEQVRKAALREARRRYHATRTTGSSPARPAPAAAEDLEGERQVRLTAQSILSGHLRDDRPAEQRDMTLPVSSFWPGMRIDLTGTTLIDLDFTHCHIAKATFTKATFTGNAGFGEATFGGDAGFDGATFGGDAGFSEATFTGGARFRKAIIGGDAWFDGATFAEGAEFDHAIFCWGALFRAATFSRAARFRNATFSTIARFDLAAFTGAALFDEATFSGDTWFGEAIIRVPDSGLIWPAGWQVSVQPDGSGVLIREGKD